MENKSIKLSILLSVFLALATIQFFLFKSQSFLNSTAVVMTFNSSTMVMYFLAIKKNLSEF